MRRRTSDHFSDFEYIVDRCCDIAQPHHIYSLSDFSYWLVVLYVSVPLLINEIGQLLSNIFHTMQVGSLLLLLPIFHAYILYAVTLLVDHLE
ncbi:MAG: hypothetical protein FJX80_07345 [Bacteroidetes bacterium]|nr:hypothetical protein [Bacteroidota bacterium]